MLSQDQKLRNIRARWLFAGILVLLIVALLIRGDRVITPGAGILAAILVAISFAMTLRAALQVGSLINGHTLVLATFMMTYPVSAFVHLTGKEYVSEGFYDLAALDPHTQFHHVYLSLALVLLAQIGLSCGIGSAQPKEKLPRDHVVRVRSTLLVLAGIVFTPVGIAGTYMLFSGAGGSLQQLATVDRARELEAGTARYAFMSSWLSWGIIFLLIPLLVSRFSKKYPLTTLVALIGGSTCMLFNMLWTGGRAENLLALLPLIFVVKKFSPRIFKTYASLIIVGVTGLIAYETYARTVGLLGSGLDLIAQSGVSMTQLVADQVAAVFDWQMGRYSTIALAFDMVRESGYGFGSTLLQGAAITLNMPATLLHIPLKLPEPEAITALIGQYLYSDPTRTGAIPGTIAELYFNFGICGVFGGFFVIGRIAKYCIGVTHSANSIGSLLLGFYSLVLLCLWTIPMTATLTLYFLATRGFPILLFYAVEKIVVYGWRRFLRSNQEFSGPLLPEAT